ncbi:MAG: DUF2530 domain-containing protein [Actinomycetes bacterium]
MSDAPADATPTAPVIEPLPVDGVAAAIVGTALWLVALVVLLLNHNWLAAHGHSWWIQVAATGGALGVPALWFVLRRRAAYRRGPDVSD